MSVVCTFCEGHYHYGVAALVNSLHAQQYRGAVYIGYRGQLPPWAGQAISQTTSHWGESHVLQVQEIQLVFLLLDTTYHLTNYKVDFMLRLWATEAREAEALFYFDPDIVVDTAWPLFEQWASHGVALCEDVNSPMLEHHPIRSHWRRYFKDKGIALRFKTDTYVNGGFVGVRRQYKEFLTTWQALMEAMAPAIGGLEKSSLHVAEPLPFDPFGKTDQDALNAAVEAWDGPVSLVGKVGMALASGQHLMSHALGTPKPWRWSVLRQALAGYAPRVADRDYWRSANGIIHTRSASTVYRNQLALKVGGFIGRFYSRR